MVTSNFIHPSCAHQQVFAASWASGGWPWVGPQKAAATASTRHLSAPDITCLDLGIQRCSARHWGDSPWTSRASSPLNSSDLESGSHLTWIETLYWVMGKSCKLWADGFRCFKMATPNVAAHLTGSNGTFHGLPFSIAVQQAVGLNSAGRDAGCSKWSKWRRSDGHGSHDESWPLWMARWCGLVWLGGTSSRKWYIILYYIIL